MMKTGGTQQPAMRVNASGAPAPGPQAAATAARLQETATAPAPQAAATTPGSQESPSGEPSAPRKVFLVGSPRSGTTLLQSILSTQGDLFTLKETHFFRRIHRWRPLRGLDRWRLEASRAEEAFAAIAVENGLDAPPALTRPVTTASACRAFEQVLAEETVHRGHSGWLEKSPEHMFFIDEIRTHIEDALFIHIVRDGPDVVASLYDAYRKYPEHWGWLGGLDAMIRLYNRYGRVSRRNRGRPDTFIVLYNDLVENDRRVLNGLAHFLGLEAGALTLDGVSSYRTDTVRADEAWKIRSETGVVDTRGTKFKSLFDQHEQERIKARLMPLSGLTSG